MALLGILFPASNFIHSEDLLLFFKFYFLDSMVFGKDSAGTYLTVIQSMLDIIH